MPRLPPAPVIADQAGALEQARRLLDIAPRLAFEKASLLQNPILRERLRRDACLAMARTQPRDAAALLPRVIHSHWLPAVDLAPVRPDRSLLLVGMLMDREALELVPAADRPFAFVEIGADLLPGFASIRFRSLGRHN